MRMVNTNEAVSHVLIVWMILIVGKIIIVVTAVGIIGISTAATLGVPAPGDNVDIATAVYGSSMNENLNILREFRDTIMLTNPPGTFIVEAYRITSPPIAAALAQSDGLRAATLVLLITPMVYLSAICLNTLAFITLIILIALTLFILRRSAKVIYILKGIGCGALTIAAFTVAVFTLGAIGYELPICAAITAYLLPVIIPASLCVCALEWIVAAKKNHKISQIHTEYI